MNFHTLNKIIIIYDHTCEFSIVSSACLKMTLKQIYPDKTIDFLPAYSLPKQDLLSEYLSVSEIMFIWVGKSTMIFLSDQIDLLKEKSILITTTFVDSSNYSTKPIDHKTLKYNASLRDILTTIISDLTKKNNKDKQNKRHPHIHFDTTISESSENKNDVVIEELTTSNLIQTTISFCLNLLPEKDNYDDLRKTLMTLYEMSHIINFFTTNVITQNAEEAFKTIFKQDHPVTLEKPKLVGTHLSYGMAAFAHALITRCDNYVSKNIYFGDGLFTKASIRTYEQMIKLAMSEFNTTLNKLVLGVDKQNKNTPIYIINGKSQTFFIIKRILSFRNALWCIPYFYPSGTILVCNAKGVRNKKLIFDSKVALLINPE